MDIQSTQEYVKQCEEYIRADKLASLYSKKKALAKKEIEDILRSAGVESIKSSSDAPWASVRYRSKVRILKGEERKLFSFMKDRGDGDLIKEGVGTKELNEYFEVLQGQGIEVPGVEAFEAAEVRVYRAGYTPSMEVSEEELNEVLS